MLIRRARSVKRTEVAVCVFMTGVQGWINLLPFGGEGQKESSAKPASWLVCLLFLFETPGCQC